MEDNPEALTSKNSRMSTGTSYLDKFEVVEDLDMIDNDDMAEDSDEDIDMKELVGATGGNLDDENNYDVINDEIEDIDSDDENA